MKTEKEKVQDQLCEKVFDTITGGTLSSDQVRNYILDTQIKEKLFDTYESFIIDFLFWAVEHGKQNKAEKLFVNIFYGDLKENIRVPFKYAIPLFACLLVGLHDIITIRMIVGARGPEDELYARLFFDSERDYPLLIVGETGTSKQLFARAVHLMGNRNKKPFQEINCAAIPEELLESELFGHEKGAFTGANKQKKGLLELAGDGIIFLDELGKMSIRLQAKILKAIDDKTFRRLGGDDEHKINARFIAAAQPNDLKKKILPDLKYRLRYPDIIKTQTVYERMQINAHGVIESALIVAKREMGFEEDFTIPDETVSLLSKYEYKGNFRQLRVILEAGMREALRDKRTEILKKDVIDILRADKEAQYKEDAIDIDAIKLKDIFDYAENIKIEIIEQKIAGILRSGKEIKTVLSGEGLNDKGYQNFRKKFKTMTGKGFSDLL